MKCWNVLCKETSTGKKYSVYFRSSTDTYAEAEQIVQQRFSNFKVLPFIKITHKKWNYFSQILPTVKFSEFPFHRSCMIEEILSPE